MLLKRRQNSISLAWGDTNYDKSALPALVEVMRCTVCVDKSDVKAPEEEYIQGGCLLDGVGWK